MFFDVHTHHPHLAKNGIYSFRLGVDQEIPKQAPYFTAGIHPWDVEEIDLNKALQDLEILIHHKKCLGIGEIGLDKSFGTNLDLQINVFKKQLELAKLSPKKVLIIHCVKAYQEIIQEKKSANNGLNWILHGFNGSEELIKSLKAYGFYFSIGELILHKNSKISKYFKQIPLDQLLFETDESKQAIEKIYSVAAQIRQIDLNKLEIVVENNLLKLFPSLNG